MGKENKIYNDGIAINVLENEDSPKKLIKKESFLDCMSHCLSLLLQLWPHGQAEEQKVKEYLLLMIQRCLGEIRTGGCKTSGTKEQMATLRYARICYGKSTMKAKIM